MSRALKFRVPAIACALAVVLCGLIARPFVEMGIADDWSYALTAFGLAHTGHIVYNGWATAMIGSQLYLGALFARLFGDTFTALRMSILLIAALTAFLLQRVLVRTGISEANATLGTLAAVLSPLFLMLSVTYMTDIQGVFAIVLCLYACLRALQTPVDSSTIAWITAAALSSTVFGSARQIAWLGVLVMVPSILWLLRGRRRVLFAGAIANLCGIIGVFACLTWFKHQPYSVPEHLKLAAAPISHYVSSLTRFLFSIPFLLLPVAVMFYAALRRTRRSTWIVIAGVIAALVILPAILFPSKGGLLVPLQGDWVTRWGVYTGMPLAGTPPAAFFRPWLKVLLTSASLLGVIALLHAARRRPESDPDPLRLGNRELFWLIVPFTAAYLVLLVPRATAVLYDRYTLGLFPVLLIAALRLFETRVQRRTPVAACIALAGMSILAVASVHNLFSLYRARLAAVQEVLASGVPDTAIDDGFEWNGWVELHHAPSLDSDRIDVFPAAYPLRRPSANPAGARPNHLDDTPHMHPVYSVAYSPDTMAGPTGFPPVSYSRWLAPSSQVYIVRFRSDPADIKITAY